MNEYSLKRNLYKRNWNKYVSLSIKCNNNIYFNIHSIIQFTHAVCNGAIDRNLDIHNNN